jgi:adenylosuccinate synthase
LLRHTCRINGVDKVAITKIDVLDGLDEIRVCIAYHFNGREIKEVPADFERLGDCEPVYEILPGWSGEKTAGITDFDGLPQAARDYVAFICRELGVEPLLISTGPDREHTIVV